VIDDDSIVGASVGDCAAWVVPQNNEPREITMHQMRKPRIGTGRANPVGFGPTSLNGVLIAMTDGVADHITGGRLAALVRRVESERLPRTLLDDIRLPSSNLRHLPSAFNQIDYPAPELRRVTPSCHLILLSPRWQRTPVISLRQSRGTPWRPVKPGRFTCRYRREPERESRAKSAHRGDKAQRLHLCMTTAQRILWICAWHAGCRRIHAGPPRLEPQGIGRGRLS